MLYCAQFAASSITQSDQVPAPAPVCVLTRTCPSSLTPNTDIFPSAAQAAVRVLSLPVTPAHCVPAQLPGLFWVRRTTAPCALIANTSLRPSALATAATWLFTSPLKADHGVSMPAPTVVCELLKS